MTQTIPIRFATWAGVRTMLRCAWAIVRYGEVVLHVPLAPGLAIACAHEWDLTRGGPVKCVHCGEADGRTMVKPRKCEVQ